MTLTLESKPGTLLPSTGRRAYRYSRFRCSKEQALIGVIGIYRQEVRPFTEKQIDLVKNFRGTRQSSPIENTRLLNEPARIFAAADRHR